MSLHDLATYIRALDRKAFTVVACRGHEPSEQDVAAFEAGVGFRLPDEFREFTMSSLGGLYVEVKEALWPRPKEYEVGPFWTLQYAVRVYGLADTIPDWLDIRVRFERLKAVGCPGLVPFLQLECDADMYCFNSAGRIVRWKHEDVEAPDPIDMTFSRLLLSELRELEKRMADRVRLDRGEEV